MSKYEIIKDKPIPKQKSYSPLQELCRTVEEMEVGDCILLSRDKKQLHKERNVLSKRFRNNKSFGFVTRKLNETDYYCWKVSKDDVRFYKDNKRIRSGRPMKEDS
tara:strand:+ start:4417 stop:4731 length:315 start_codon:yes stop_codon:yes gene_type:complete